MWIISLGQLFSKKQGMCLVLQKKAIGILVGLAPLDSFCQVLRELRILTVILLYICEDTCFTITQKPYHVDDSHSYNTRNIYDYSLLTQHLTHSKSNLPAWEENCLINSQKAWKDAEETRILRQYWRPSCYRSLFILHKNF